MPLLELNISANQHLFQFSRPQATILDWDEDLPDSIQNAAGRPDVIMYGLMPASCLPTPYLLLTYKSLFSMADVTYNTSSFPALIRTLSRLISLPGRTRPPMVLLGYKERDPSERTLWDMAKGIGIVFKEVGERKGAGGENVEIWIGTVKNQKT